MKAPLSNKTLAAILVLVAVAPLAVAGTKTTGTWCAPELKPATYAKVAVLAKVADDITRRILEDAVVEGLAKQGVQAVAAYQVFTPADMASDQTIQAKAQELGVDAGLVFTVTGEDQQIKSNPQVHASVGVPVRAGPFSVFLGTSVPLGGGTSVSKSVGVRSEFFNGSDLGPMWMANYSTDLKGGNERAAQEVAAQALKAIKKAGVFQKGN